MAATGREFDSSEMRSGRPFAFAVGNGDVVRGLDLGVLEMCIGEERLVQVPPRLGLGPRASKAFGIPPDAALEYRVRLVPWTAANLAVYFSIFWFEPPTFGKSDSCR